MSNIIQFKRCLTFRGTYDEAKTALQSLNPPLEPGESILISYLDGTELKYFISIGVDDYVSVVYPTYSSLEEINDNINSLIQDSLSKYTYDWIQDIDQDSSNVIFNRDLTTGLITVNYAGSGETASYASEMETIIGGTTMTQQEFNELIINLLTWSDIN